MGPTESAGRQGVAEDGGLTLESQDVHGITPLAASSPLSRYGREVSPQTCNNPPSASTLNRTRGVCERI